MRVMSFVATDLSAVDLRPSSGAQSEHTLRKPRAYRSPTVLATAALVLLVSGVLLIIYHDRSWWGPDDGNFAHVAERILDGEVLNRDVQDVHAGYINFANAGAMALFGREIVSMRYPLIVLALGQALLVFALLGERGTWAAACGAMAMTALGVIQFVNPTPHWYCLFLAVALIGWLRWIPLGRRLRTEGAGFLVMTVFLLRQLSGVLLGIGLLCFLLLESDEGEAAGRPVLARALIVTMLGGLCWYLARATSLSGWLFFGTWPIGLLLLALRRVAVANPEVRRMTRQLLVGAGLAAAPLVTYHVVHGSLVTWFGDVVVAAVSLPQLPFIDNLSYAVWVLGGAVVVGSGEPRLIVSAVFWIVAPLVAAFVGVAVVRRVAQLSTGRLTGRDALPILAVFYAVVSVHYAIPIYLFYTLPLSAAAVLVVAGGPGSRRSWAATVVIGALSVHAVVFNAGQPIARYPRQIVEGRGLPVVTVPALPRAGVLMERSDARHYTALVERIQREVPVSRSIAAIPSHAELYFLAERRNPWRFFNTALGVRDARGLEDAVRALDRDPPVLVFHDTADKYNTMWSDSLMHFVRSRYVLEAAEGRILVYRERALSPLTR
jgi:hypothetical protein